MINIRGPFLYGTFRLETLHDPSFFCLSFIKNMARPHHRKKHKQHLQQFKQRGEGSSDTAKSKGSNVFAIGGAFFGLAIGFIASSGEIVWMIAGLIIGGLAGYFIGDRVDREKK